MSRSYKKKLISKDSKPKDNYHNKLVRRETKQRIKQGKHPRQTREIINDWDVCDWVLICRNDDIFNKDKFKRK